MTKLGGVVVLMSVLVAVGTGCAAPDDGADEGATESSQDALYYAYSGSGSTYTSPTEVYEPPPEPETFTCPYEVIDGQCLQYHTIRGPGGGYYTTYNPCRIGTYPRCNAFGVCTCG